jgi:subtilase family protein
MADASPPLIESRPLLAFPPPVVGPIPPSDTRPPYRPVHRPTAGRQATRLTPQFETLREAIEHERAELSEATSAMDPELVAVFDLAGSVETFIRAASLVEGLEFLGDLQEDYVDPDDDFYYETDGEVSDSGVPQSLYMVMTNAEAVAELVRLFELWRQNQSITFARGLNPLKEVFGLLRAIRRWGPEDRVRETGLLEQWAEDLAVVGAQGTARVEVELWYRADEAVRRAAQTRVAELVTTIGGTVVAVSDHPGIAYHAMLADVPMEQVERVLAEGPSAIDLLKTETIMLVSPNRPMMLPATEPTIHGDVTFDATLPEHTPRIGVLDGLPLANHITIDGRLVIDDPDDRAAKYAANQRSHGTATTSLIAHGDLTDPGPALRRRIYVRPILEPHDHFQRLEIVPRDELIVDLVFRSFIRMFEGDDEGEPTAASVRIVNLAIGDPVRVFVRRLSPLARMLDWLANRYNVVIVVSAGNHSGVQPAVSSVDLSDSEATRTAAMRSLRERARERRLLSPAEAINVVTVGALHDDKLAYEQPDTVVDLTLQGGPASYSPVGFGFRRSVKPEVLLPGGRQLFRSPPPGSTGTVEVEPAITAGTGPGLRVATPGPASELDYAGFSSGTSNAAALATRTLSHIFDELESLGEHDSPLIDTQYQPVLAKTLLVHAAGWHDLADDMRSVLGLSGPATRRQLTQLLGYGPLRPDRVATAHSGRVVLIGTGSIGKDQRHSFQFPLPPVLSASTEWRRLTITLGWFSPISVRSQKYRMARLWFTPPRDELALTPMEADQNAVVKGTTQHQVLEGEAAVAFVDGSQLAIDVDCRSDAGPLATEVHYGLAASLEVSTAVQVELHEQVRQRIRARVREQART